MSVEISLLGRFEVCVDGTPVPESAWSRRQAAALVKILALAPRRQLHREQVMDALWPDVAVDEAGPRLHKAAHFARRVLGPDSVVLRAELVLLFPGVTIGVDTLRFQELAARALETGEPADAGKAADAYGGQLLPEDRYEPWAAEPRERLQLQYLQLLRQARLWAELVEIDPADTEAHLELMRQHTARGDRRAALRQFERMDRALNRELGVGPSDEAIALRDTLLDAQPETLTPTWSYPLVGRAQVTSALESALDEAARGRGRTVLLSGAPGMGKSVLSEWLRGQGVARGWRTGSGVASAIEGAWPYAPVLETLADLCRRHPTLLDGLVDRCREDIDRALSGRPLDWHGEHSHQRLFVAVAELVRLAAAGSGVVLTIDDVHEADEASLRLIHYLARSCSTERLLLLLAHRRQPVSDAFEQVRSNLLSRASAVNLALNPLDRSETGALARLSQPDLSPEAAEHIWEVSGGVPFAVTELARTVNQPDPDKRLPGNAVLAVLSPPTRTALEYVATTGSTFDTDEFLALAGLPEEEAFDCLDAALAALVVERTRAGYRFRHPLIRDALLADIPPHRQQAIHRICAQRLIDLDASPARIGHHLLAAGEAESAVPYVLRAVETEAAVGAYRDALSLLEPVRTVAMDAELTRVLVLRAELLGAMGDSAAIQAYRQAIAAETDDIGRRRLRAKMALVSLQAGELDTAAAILDTLEPDGGPDDATILLAKGNLAYLKGDMDAAMRAADAASRMEVASATWQQLDLISLKGLLTHNRGEWSQLLRAELVRTLAEPVTAIAIFDSHLCVAEYLLYGPTAYTEVMGMARTLRSTAERAGALRAVAFATALIGEASLLYGDLDQAERELADSADLHREIGSIAGEAHSLQRLAEVRLARGDRPGANRLLRRALPLARWSMHAMHLLQRVYGTMVAAAEDHSSARAVVDAAQATLTTTDYCYFCNIMFDVPAAIACADSGDIAEAQRHLKLAEHSAMFWEGTAWQAALLEVRAHIARAEGDCDGAVHLIGQAADLFEESAQPLDADRCRQAVAGMRVPSEPR